MRKLGRKILILFFSTTHYSSILLPISLLIVLLGPCHFIILQFCYLLVPKAVLLEPCHFIILQFCYLLVPKVVLLGLCHFIILQFCYLLPSP